MKAARPADGYALAVPIEIRFRDVDAMGHVNNAVYFSYFENARLAYWKAVGLDRPGGEVAYVLARAECDFRRPVTLDDAVACHIRVSWFGTRSFAFEYLLRDERSGGTVAEGRTVQATYDYAARRAVPLGGTIRSAIERFEGRTIPARGRA